MYKTALMLAAPSSNSGKTTLTLALLRLLAREGLEIQPFKCGPDYLDTFLHSLAASVGGAVRQGKNLDVFMASPSHMREVFFRSSEGADAVVIEGVMGLFDGAVKSEGSSAAIAKMLDVPVVLVVDAKGAAYSVAPLLYGFKHFDPAVRLAGVIFNRVNTCSHYEFLKEACRDVGVEALGYVPSHDAMEVSGRYLGLNISADADQESAITAMADHVSQTVDIDLLRRICRVDMAQPSAPAVTNYDVHAVIGVARDDAFNFFYAENLDVLRRYGKVEFFSPLDDSCLPDVDMLYFSGGYPELYARRLEQNVVMRQSIKDFALRGGIVYAECGGMMYLGNSITCKDGQTYCMCGALDLDTSMEDVRLHLGYRKVDLSAAGYAKELRGHEFHYSRLTGIGDLESVAAITTARDRAVETPFYRFGNTFASYIHLYWGETPGFPGYLLEQRRGNNDDQHDDANPSVV